MLWANKPTTWRSLHSPLIFEVELDVQGPQVGMQPGILDGHDKGISARFVHMFVPVARWCDERGTFDPVHPSRVLDVSLNIEFGPKQGVSTGFGVDDEIQCDRLMAMGKLTRSGGNDPEHRPKRMSDGQCLSEVSIRKKDTNAAAFA